MPVPGIEQAAHGRVVEQPQHDVDDVAHPDEVALLLAVRDTGLEGFEQARLLPVDEVVVFDFDDRDHCALVVFIRAVDVEELQAGPLRRPAFAACQRPRDRQVEAVLAPAVEVPRMQAAERGQGNVVVETFRTATVGGGGRGVDQADAAGDTPVPKGQRQFDIAVPDEVAVSGSRGADGRPGETPSRSADGSRESRRDSPAR